MNPGTMTAKTNAPEYHQVNNIRFLSMVAIVAIHTEFLQLEFFGSDFNIAVFQIFKFGTICFFIISGFLLGDKLAGTRPIDYFKDRISSIFPPWLFWASLYTAMLLVVAASRKGVTLADIANAMSTTVRFTSYWFVINLLFSLGVLVLFRKCLHRLWFGFVLLLGSLFYGINTYFSWVATSHMMAFFGFIFYLWLGVQLGIHRNGVLRFVNSTRWIWFLLAIIGSITFAMVEANILSRRTSDFENSLRISNQIYSLVIFFTLFKIQGPISPSWMNVRSQTYGIYLVHWIILYCLHSCELTLGARYYQVPRPEFKADPSHFVTSLTLKIAMWMAVFFIAYFSSWLITKAIVRADYPWLVGVKKKVQPSLPPSFAADQA